ncbi:MAG TPA: 50S ribosomal protein L25/general stress protein Ctc [Marmoricola sp.]|nr:50S ribosomal protein L25/general stress protein Ctc [Marmoricola sp.]
MSEELIQAERRTEFGKGAARRIRRESKIPAVIYGHGNEPVHVTLPGHDTTMAIKHGGANAVLSIELDGKVQLALTKQVQADPIKRVIEHVDFVAVKKGEKVTVDVQIVVVGEAASETMVHLENQTVSVEAEATHIPESFEVSVEGAEAGTQIHASSLELPKGSTLLSDPELLVVNVTAAVAAEETTDETAEGEEAAEGGDEAAAGEAPAEEAPSED